MTNVMFWRFPIQCYNFFSYRENISRVIVMMCFFINVARTPSGKSGPFSSKMKPPPPFRHALFSWWTSPYCRCVFLSTGFLAQVARLAVHSPPRAPVAVPRPSGVRRERPPLPARASRRIDKEDLREVNPVSVTFVYVWLISIFLATVRLFWLLYAGEGE